MLRSPARKNRETNPAKKRVETPPLTKGNMQVRVVSLAVLIALVFAVLGARLWYLQVLTGEEYNVMAQNTGTLTVKDPAQRGVIYDRDGEILANNEPGLNVTVIPNEIGRGRTAAEAREKVGELAEILGADPKSVQERYDAAIDPVTGAAYSPILVKENADQTAVTYISERTEEFDGVQVNDDWVRNYPQGNLASHVLGYTGAITPDELKLDAFKGLSNDSIVGKSGVEVYYEETLRGEAGWQKYDVDVLGRIVPDGARVNSASEFVDENGNPIESNPTEELPDHVKDPKPGDNLRLTVDVDLQKVVETELDAALDRTRAEGYEGRGGAVIAMNPENGEVLALASRPDFDPQLFVGGISGDQELEEYEYLSSERSGYPFTNRAIVGGQPGASTFKIFTGLAGMAAGVIDAYTIITDSAIIDENLCWSPSSVSVSPCYSSWRQNSPNYEYLGNHGPQNFSEAIADSNDIFFYQVADWIWNQTEDKDWMPKYYERWGFGKLTGIDISGESAGRVPTEAGERELYRALHGSAEEAYWSVGDWINLSIGQGDLLVSPVQMATAYSALYNGGTLVTPHVAKDVRDQSGKVVAEITPEPAGQVDTNQAQIDAVINGFRGVTAKKGTAENIFKGSELPTIGKSGTGELPSEPGEAADYVNWFAGWTEGQDEPLVVVTMIEGGGAFETGSELTAGPVVRHVLEAYYGVEQSPEDPQPTGTRPIDPADRQSTEAPTVTTATE
ncbi:penicillin-binding protein 2 [Rubrobacter tropicus]|uniref:Penicillin-binding protein 2 n=1 Tax=Rubrobacter tropicus TaxID=2653851 RepID=A0A6G8Q883_9ACTN|nr:penicillin-binding protein 2 [Rubrobacter tropicus]QIN82694.1 penicillin-binding protein 2 [Rubrobacter tropicus]